MSAHVGNKRCGLLQGNLSPLHKLCLVRLLKPEALVQASQQYVADNLGPQFVAPPPVALTDVWKDSDNATPVIFILSSGQHPCKVAQ